jgi:SAM-dependent methyltransferase
MSPNPIPIQQSEDGYGEDYLAWKQWSTDGSFGVCTRRDQLYFDAEMKRTGLTSVRDVLEIGFGSGSFLAYARGRGWQVQGSEANPALLAAATRASYPALRPAAVAGLPENSLDLIVAFDVFEHIAPDALVQLLGTLRGKLRVGGAILARFPNGDSPFGLSNQNGDVTHAHAISSAKLRYFASTSALEVVDLGPEAFPVIAGDWKTTAYRAIVAPIRAVIEAAIKALYFPRSEVYFTAPNLVAVLRKPAA